MLHALLLCILLNACTQNKTTTPVTTTNTLQGHYINTTVLNHIADTIPGGIPAYCFEMNFISPDSVAIFTGDEEYTLAYKKTASGYTLLNAVFDGELPFTLNADSTLTLDDATLNETQTNSVFKKVNSTTAQEWVFENYLNEKMIAGEYVLYNNDAATPQKVIFMADGHVTGLNNYISYTICYAGDCIGETIPLRNTITFNDNNGSVTDYAFTVNTTNQHIMLFAIAPAVEDIKGEREIRELVFEMRRIKEGI